MSPSSVQEQVLSHYRTFYEEHRVSPTIRQASEALGFSGTTIYTYLRILAAKGLLERAPGKRGYIPTRDGVA